MRPERNSIPEDQNSPRGLERLAAQRQLYSRAKLVLGAQLALTVPLAATGAFLATFVPGAKGWASLYGICVAIIDAAVLDPLQKSLKHKAALIQERFDCDVLRLEWPEWKGVGRPDAELVHEEAGRYRRRDPEFATLRDWYPVVVGVLPLHLARIVCQRSSLRYDSGLRRRYNGWVVALLAALSVAVFASGLAGGVSVEKFVLTFLAPLSPAFLWAIREFKRQGEAAEALEKLKKQAEGLWADALGNADPSGDYELRARRLQDEILERRRNNPLIFDRVYDMLRGAREAQMNRAAEELVEEAMKSLSQQAARR